MDRESPYTSNENAAGADAFCACTFPAKIGKTMPTTQVANLKRFDFLVIGGPFQPHENAPVEHGFS
jgi:hypothetical protein